MQHYDIGRTFGRAFTVIRSGMGSVGLFLLAITVLTQLVQGGLFWLMGEQVSQLAAGGDRDAMTDAMFTLPLYWLSIAAAMVLSVLGTGGAMAGYARLCGGHTITIDECLSEGIARFLPVLGVNILWSLGIMLGFLVFIVPGVILIVIWTATLPAVVVERKGVFDAFGRSRSLTRGSRGMVFVTLLVLAVLLYGAPSILGLSLLGGVEQFVTIPGDGLPYAVVAGATVYGWLGAMVHDAVLVSIHHELVEVTEGGSTGELSEVFG